MKLITFDVGNTRIGAARVQASDVADRFEGRPATPGNDPAARVAEAFDWCLDQAGLHPDIQGMVLSSVVPAETELLSALWHGHPDLGRRPLHVVDFRSPLPMVVDVEEPATVGADRYCNVAGAVRLGYTDAIVVDLGTANTFDLLQDGVFRGGLIGPGAVTAHRALIDAGARLPGISFSWPVDLVGRTTPEAIRSGSFHQAVGGVLHVVERLRGRLPGATVLVTGGLAEILGPELGDQALHVAALTHLGAAEIGRAALA